MFWNKFTIFLHKSQFSQLDSNVCCQFQLMSKDDAKRKHSIRRSFSDCEIFDLGILRYFLLFALTIANKRIPKKETKISFKMVETRAWNEPSDVPRITGFHDGSRIELVMVESKGSSDDSLEELLASES